MEVIDIPEGANLFDYGFDGVCEVPDIPATGGWQLGPWWMLAVPFTAEDREGLRRTNVLKGRLLYPEMTDVGAFSGRANVCTVAFVFKP